MRFDFTYAVDHVDVILFRSEATVARRRKKIGLRGSGLTTKALPGLVKRQLVLDQMGHDPTSRQGPRLIKEGILYNTGVNLTRYAQIS